MNRDGIKNSDVLRAQDFIDQFGEKTMRELIAENLPPGDVLAPDCKITGGNGNLLGVKCIFPDGDGKVKDIILLPQ